MFYHFFKNIYSDSCGVLKNKFVDHLHFLEKFLIFDRNLRTYRYTIKKSINQPSNSRRLHINIVHHPMLNFCLKSNRLSNSKFASKIYKYETDQMRKILNPKSDEIKYH